MVRNAFDYIFYCHYILFQKVKRDDSPEATAAFLMASGHMCILITILFASGQFFVVGKNPLIWPVLSLLLMAAYYFYFARKQYYKVVAKRFAKSRQNEKLKDKIVALVSLILSHYCLILYVLLAY